MAPFRGASSNSFFVGNSSNGGNSNGDGDGDGDGDRDGDNDIGDSDILNFGSQGRRWEQIGMGNLELEA